MSLSICYFDVATKSGQFKENGIYVLHGEGDQLEYALLTANAVLHKAKCVAVAHGIDVTTEGGKAVIVYATKEFIKDKGFDDWIQGKTLDECFPDTIDDSTMVNCININGTDYLRDDKNCVTNDKIGAVEGGKQEKAGWYDTAGNYCGDGDRPDGFTTDNTSTATNSPANSPAIDDALSTTNSALDSIITAVYVGEDTDEDKTVDVQEVADVDADTSDTATIPTGITLLQFSELFKVPYVTVKSALERFGYLTMSASFVPEGKWPIATEKAYLDGIAHKELMPTCIRNIADECPIWDSEAIVRVIFNTLVDMSYHDTAVSKISQLESQCAQLTWTRDYLQDKVSSHDAEMGAMRKAMSEFVLGIKRHSPDEFDVLHVKDDWHCFQYQLTMNGQLQPTRFFLAQMSDFDNTTLLLMLKKLLEYRNNGWSFSDEGGYGEKVILYFRSAVSRDLCIQLVAHELLPPSVLRDEMAYVAETLPLPGDGGSPLDIPTTFP